MPGQGIIPLTNKHEATENLLEGFGIRTRLKAHSRFECIGNLLASIGSKIASIVGKASADKLGGGTIVNLVSQPFVKILAGASRSLAINILSTPLAPTESFATRITVEEQE
ncbi:hypothetical protein X943_001421 [Babesia divergens]|uniref:Uncharacterized protein n=1 Tax=Babesia divergens TaxID=32595 RepID=A0AAD9GBK5_BABDI|nr:hypothetical protein X943_001421 [Babesia divergens]